MRARPVNCPTNALMARAAASVSLSVVVIAPASVQLLALIAWWSAALLDLRGIGPGLPQAFPNSLLHAPLLLLMALPPLFFGFLLTVFPRWLGFPDTRPVIYAPVGIAFGIGAALLWVGLLGGYSPVLIAALASAGAGWAWALIAMIRWLHAERKAGKGPSWHGWSALAAASIGFACLLTVLVAIGSLNGALMQRADRIALNLFILPVFFTVCHRMVPFFAGNVVANYAPWRPYWLLGIFWLASLVATAGVMLSMPLLAAAGYLGLCLLCAVMAWRWCPRSAAPGLLWVLIIGFGWAPIGYGLEALSALNGNFASRDGIHALTIGFAGSLLIAMVTRVTQGHSGRPLKMPVPGWIAFAGVQLSVAARLVSSWRAEDPDMLILSAIIMLALLTPWVVNSVRIYAHPRSDGKPG